MSVKKSLQEYYELQDLVLMEKLSQLEISRADIALGRKKLICEKQKMSECQEKVRFLIDKGLSAPELVWEYIVTFTSEGLEANWIDEITQRLRNGFKPL